MRQVYLNAAAERDLIGIWRYTFEQWGANQADGYLEELDQGIGQLAHDAQIGAERGSVRSGYRVLFINSHAVYYRVAPTEIRIIRVLHGRMDPKLHLRR